MTTTAVTMRVDTKGHAAKCVALQLLYGMMPEGTDIQKLSNACEVIANETRMLADVLPLLEADTFKETAKNLVSFIGEQLGACGARPGAPAVDVILGKTFETSVITVLSSLFDTHGYARQAVDCGWLPEDCTNDSYSDALKFKLTQHYVSRLTVKVVAFLQSLLARGEHETLGIDSSVLVPSVNMIFGLYNAACNSLIFSVLECTSKVFDLNTYGILKFYNILTREEQKIFGLFETDYPEYT